MLSPALVRERRLRKSGFLFRQLVIIVRVVVDRHGYYESSLRTLIR